MIHPHRSSRYYYYACHPTMCVVLFQKTTITGKHIIYQVPGRSYGTHKNLPGIYFRCFHSQYLVLLTMVPRNNRKRRTKSAEVSYDKIKTDVTLMKTTLQPTSLHIIHQKTATPLLKHPLRSIHQNPLSIKIAGL